MPVLKNHWQPKAGKAVLKIMKTIFLALFFSCSLSLAAAKPGCFFITAGDGLIIGGPLSPGDAFRGNKVFTHFGYSWSPSGKIGLAPEIGFTILRCRQSFSEQIFLQHEQHGFNVNLPVLFQLQKRLQLRTGISFFVPVISNVELGEKAAQTTFFYGTTALQQPYRPSPVQAGPMIGLNYSAGKKENFLMGFSITQMAVSAVREDAVYNDSFGNQLVISSKQKPLHFSLYFGLALRDMKSGKTKENEA